MRHSEEITDLRFRHSSQFLSVLLGGKAYFFFIPMAEEKVLFLALLFLA